MTPSQPGPTLDSYPTERSCPFSPPDAFDRLRGQAELPTVEVLRGGRPWLITRYEDARAVLASENFSARIDRSGFPLVTPTDLQQLDSERPSLVRTDDPEHLQKRRRLTRDFTVKRINALEPEIQRVIDECVDGLLRAGRPADLVAELALPVPSRVICLLLGVPYDKHEFFQRKSAEALSGQADVDTVRTALDELAEYLDELAEQKLRAPQEDLISRLVHEFHEPGIMDRAELINTAMTLLIAGFETTSNMISLGTAALLHHPAQLERFLAGDSAFQANAVEELLRYLTIAQNPRQFVAVADTRIGDNLIRAGEGVLVSLPSANRDPAAFDDADVLDLGRSARHHLAFSYGTHQCLGQSLARRELLLTFQTLFTRVPTLRLVDSVEEFDLKIGTRVHGFNSLNVTW